MTAWTRLPPQPTRINRASQLARGVTHLVNGGFPMNAVTGEIALQNVTSRVVHPTPLGDAFRCNGESKGWAFRATAAQINARNPWTIATLAMVDANISGVSGSILGHLGISATAGNQTGTYDRVLSVGASAAGGVVYPSAKLFDGASKEITATVGIADYLTTPKLYTVVATALNGVLSIFVNGQAAGTVAISNNGHNGYADPIYFNISSLGVATGYRILEAVKTDNVPWGQSEAVDFARNPFNLFAPRVERTYFVPTVAADNLFAQACL